MGTINKTPNISNKRRKGVKISQLNIVSFRRHSIEVEQLMNDLHLDILSLNETRLHRDILDQGVLLLVVVVVVYFILSRLLCLALSANLGLLCMSHPGMGPLV